MEKQVLKKLVLKKETISNLSNNSMNQIAGGTNLTDMCYNSINWCGSIQYPCTDWYATAWFHC